MFTASDIKNVTFSSSMRGFKPEEVDIFLDKVEGDYHQFEKIINDYKQQIESLNKEIEGFKSSQESIQNVLLNAQKLADQIVNEAKVKSEEIVAKAETNINVITAQEKELADAFEMKANERKAALQNELDQMIEKAKIKSNSIMAAADDSVKRQQVLFDKLKLEIATFKSSITAKYKEHLSILQEIPDTVEMEPEALSEIISAKVDALPNIDSFINVPTFEEPVSDDLIISSESNGFVVENSVEE
ncbi:MAG: DivIVA domain-containing protein [Ruminococcaceae bacterium]|nr:DivIVA domain-containing protein [Oscillospiraceae bacterium]